MKLELGKTYKTKNGGSVRIICTDRVSMHGKHYVGLYNGDNGEWVLTYDDDGGAYVFDTPKIELNIVPEKRKAWVVSYVDTNNVVCFDAWNVLSFKFKTADIIRNHYEKCHYTDIRIKLVEL